MDSTTAKKRGRPKRTKVDEFQAKAWYNTIANHFDLDVPFHLERIIEPGNIKRDQDGKLYSNRAWDKYRNGSRSPKDGMKRDGTPNVVVLAEQRVPQSAEIYRHPIWRVLREDVIGVSESKEIIYSFRDYVRRYYFDLELPSLQARLDSFGANVCLPIQIGSDDDLIVSLDHLAIHLLILKMDPLLPTDVWYLGIKENINMTLGPISRSPWIGPFYREFFEWLENEVWERALGYWFSNS